MFLCPVGDHSVPNKRPQVTCLLHEYTIPWSPIHSCNNPYTVIWSPSTSICIPMCYYVADVKYTEWGATYSSSWHTWYILWKLLKSCQKHSIQQQFHTWFRKQWVVQKTSNKEIIPAKTITLIIILTNLYKNKIRLIHCHLMGLIY